MHKARPQRPVHTYSIVARDPETGEMGVAVQSHWFSVGSLCPWTEAGVGAVATQALVNPGLGPRGLALLKEGRTAPEALSLLLEEDKGRDVRQVALVDAAGNAAAHTGPRCIPEAGHVVGDGFSVQANMMLDDGVWPAMAEAFAASSGPLAERLVGALQAAQDAGGDIRGQQSAALLVVRAEPTGNVWQDRLVDLRVEDHAEPVVELERLLRVHRAYGYMNQGDEAMEHDDVDGALQAYGKAEKLFPNNLEMRFWHGISLANAGMVDQALPMLGAVFAQDGNWRTLAARLSGVGLLGVDGKSLARILALSG